MDRVLGEAFAGRIILKRQALKIGMQIALGRKNGYLAELHQNE